MKKVKESIISFYNTHHRMPSFSEIMDLCGYKSKSAVSYAINKLINEGVVGKDKKGRLIPVRLGEARLLGLVEAGFPSPAEEELVDTMSFDQYLIENPEATYILKVKGDSMIDAGIHSGDMVIVERGANYRNGDIVVAEVDGEWTIKFFRERGGRPFLEPANKDYEPIYPKQELSITAVVRAVVRKY